LEVPDSLHALLGDYILPGGQGALTVFWEDGSVKIVDPGKRVTPLTRAESEGTWFADEDPPKVVTYPTNPAGSVMAMTLREVVSLPRVESEEGIRRGCGVQPSPWLRPGGGVAWRMPWNPLPSGQPPA
jgi:hypothetical protein